MTALAGKRALVTGAAMGIGAAIAARLAQDGAAVIIADIDERAGRQCAETLGQSFHALDVANEGSWAALAAHLAETGGLDILINNAGVNPGPAALDEMTLAHWRSVHAVNLDGVFLGCRTALRLMAAAGGAIVNIGSAAGVRPPADMAAYASSKAGVHVLTRAVALHAGRRGLNVRCNTLAPGSVETPMVARLRAATGDAEAARARTAALHPIGRVGEPGDIAGAAAFLVGPDARFITGALFAVDGGLTA